MAQPDIGLSPELAEAASLHIVVQAELDHAGHPLIATPHPSPGWAESATRVGDDRRHSTIVTARDENLFLLDFRERGVRMAHGSTTDPAAAAGAAALWQNRFRLHELRATYPFVEFGELALAYEQGDPVATRWEIYRRTRGPHFDSALIEAAHGSPRLRQLFPYRSHTLLLLSRCTRFPYTRDLPAIDPHPDATYHVHWPGDPAPIAVVNTPRQAVDVVEA